MYNLLIAGNMYFLNKKIEINTEIKYVIRYVLSLFITTRIVLTIIGMLSRILLEGLPNVQYQGSPHLILAIWGVWDTKWYMDIAQNGYAIPDSIPPSYSSQENWAFFPLYPILMRIIGSIFGGKYYLSGLIISNICLMLASFLLYYLVRSYYGRKIALRSVKFLYLFPISFIFSGVFTEAVYLALTLSCFVFLYQKKYLLTSISGFFLALTRTLGVLIVIPILYEILKVNNFKIKNIKPEVVYLILIPLGLILFSIYNYYLTGDFLAFKNIQSASGWDRHISNPVAILLNAIQHGFIDQINIRIIVELSITIISLVCLGLWVKKIKLSFLLFAFYSIMIPLSTSLDSMPRYILPVFPLYIILAKLSKNRFVDQTITIVMSLIQGVLMVFWSYGMAIIV